MSNIKLLTKHPETKQFELATWIDNYFEEHNYGIIFDSSPNVVHDSRDEEFETKSDGAFKFTPPPLTGEDRIDEYCVTNHTMKHTDVKNSMVFYTNEKEEVLRISKDGFYYCGKKVEDINDVYTRFTEWLNEANMYSRFKDIIKTHIEANTENNMISLEARLAVDKELNELLEEIK